MEKEVIILIAEDDDGHATLIQRNLKRAGIVNEIVRFKDGKEVLEYLFQKGEGEKRKSGKALLLLLDIRMPKIDGLEVLKRVKADHDLKKMPVMMITTTDDPREVELCHELGCSNYVTKPIDYEKFVDAVRKLGLFLLVVQVPVINGK
jgi:CheY-like chemotaxis protein